MGEKMTDLEKKNQEIDELKKQNNFLKGELNYYKWLCEETGSFF